MIECGLLWGLVWRTSYVGSHDLKYLQVRAHVLCLSVFNYRAAHLNNLDRFYGINTCKIKVNYNI